MFERHWRTQTFQKQVDYLKCALNTMSGIVSAQNTSIVDKLSTVIPVNDEERKKQTLWQFVHFDPNWELLQCFCINNKPQSPCCKGDCGSGGRRSSNDRRVGGSNPAPPRLLLCPWSGH